MSRLLIGISIVALLLMSANIQAAYVIDTLNNAIVNYSFEQPGDGKHNAWDIETNAKGSFTDVPGWYSDWTANDSGVETGYAPTGYSGFLMNSPDPSVWQILPYKVVAGDQYMLAVDAKDNWNGAGADVASQLKITLFYIGAGGARVELKSEVVDLDYNESSAWGGHMSEWFTYTLNVTDASAAVGHLLGIELQNVSAGASSSWLGIDNVRFIPEPATIALLGLGGLALIRRKR